MPRPMIPNNQAPEALEEYLVNMQASLHILDDSAKESILKRQIWNMREYNRRQAVQEHS